MTLEYIKTSQAESRARELERQGCDLIVARGVQARIIKQSVKLPVVEISVTLQELASVMLELKSELALPCPRIGLIGVANMFSDTSRFNELFGIELKLYMVRQNEELANAVSQAQADGCVGVIGGDIVCETARQKKLAYKYIPTGQRERPQRAELRQPGGLRHRSGKAQLRRDQRPAELHLQRHHPGGLLRRHPPGQPHRLQPAGTGFQHPSGLLHLRRPAQPEPHHAGGRPAPGQRSLLLPAGHQPQGRCRQHRPHSGGQSDRGCGADLPGRPAPDRYGQRDAP